MAPAGYIVSLALIYGQHAVRHCTERAVDAFTSVQPYRRHRYANTYVATSTINTSCDLWEINKIKTDLSTCPVQDDVYLPPLHDDISNNDTMFFAINGRLV